MIDIITAVFNEEEGIREFVLQIDAVFKDIEDEYRIIIVDDGSNDSSEMEILDLKENGYPIKYIKLSRNFGQNIAITCGLDYASGDANVIIDSDLQDPPQLIKDFIREWKNGYDVVYGIRKSRDGETWIKKITSKWFYKVMRHVAKPEIPADVGDFRLVSKKVLTSLKEMKEKNRYMKGILSWVGFKSKGLYFEREKRSAGISKYSYQKMFNLSILAICSFSSVPLKVWSLIGMFVSGLAFLYLLFIIINALYFGITMPGYSSLISVSLFLGGLQLLSIGVLGEYISLIYTEVKDRPLYIVEYES